MAKVSCDVDYDHEVYNPDTGRNVEGINVTCNRCGHSAECYGRSEASVRRALATLREECPEGERNYYIEEDGPEDE